MYPPRDRELIRIARLLPRRRVSSLSLSLIFIFLLFYFRIKHKRADQPTGAPGARLKGKNRKGNRERWEEGAKGKAGPDDAETA